MLLALSAVLATPTFAITGASPTHHYVSLSRRNLDWRDTGPTSQKIPSAEGFWFGDFTVRGSSH